MPRRRPASRSPTFGGPAGGGGGLGTVEEEKARVPAEAEDEEGVVGGLGGGEEDVDVEDGEEEIVIEGSGGQGDSLMTWDSTRGLLSSDKFPLALGGASLADSRDDVYPRALRIVLHVARGQRPEAMLRRVVRADRKIIEVNSTEQFPSEDRVIDRYVKVGSEWMLVGNHDKGEAVVQRRCRQSGSSKTVHRIGDPVFVGRVFRKTLSLPAARSWWSGEDR